jgi:hypothetical protein
MYLTLSSVPKPSHEVISTDLLNPHQILPAVFAWWLMRDSVKEKSMVSLRTDAECPSLSPDQTETSSPAVVG